MISILVILQLPNINPALIRATLLLRPDEILLADSLDDSLGPRLVCCNIDDFPVPNLHTTEDIHNEMIFSLGLHEAVQRQVRARRRSRFRCLKIAERLKGLGDSGDLVRVDYEINVSAEAGLVMKRHRDSISHRVPNAHPI